MLHSRYMFSCTFCSIYYVIRNVAKMELLTTTPSGFSPPCGTSGDQHDSYGNSRAFYRQGAFGNADGLPQQFVKSMRTLFTILDDSRTGLVPLREIERRWCEDAVPNLPGVLDALREIAPENGLLSFDNFVYGLKIALSARKKDVPVASFGSKATGSKEYGAHQTRPLTSSSSMVFQQSNVAKVAPSWQRPPSASHVFNKPLHPVGGNSAQTSRSSRPFRSNRRRSNSGPITTATVFPTARDPPAEVKWQHFGSSKMSKSMYTDPFTQQPPGDICGLAQNLFSSPTSENHNIGLSANDDAVFADTSVTQAEHLPDNQVDATDHITAKTFRGKEGTSGRYIGITGSLKRHKSTACLLSKQFGSLGRPKKHANSARGSTPPVKETEESQNRHVDAPKYPGPDYVNRETQERFPQRNYLRETATAPSDSQNRENSSQNLRKYQYTRSFEVRPDGSGSQCDSTSSVESPPAMSRAGSKLVHAESYHSGFSASPPDSRPSVANPLIASPSSLIHDFLKENIPKASNMRPGSRYPSHDSAQTSSGRSTSPPVSRRRRANSTSSAKRRDQRRHTVASGIDHNLIKSLKQIEEEKGLLLQGLECINKARNWFERQMTNVEERRKYLEQEGRSSPKGLHGTSFQSSSYTGQAQQVLDESEVESMQRDFEALSQTLRDLLKVRENSDTDQVPSQTEPTGGTEVLKIQNRQLTQELSDKNVQITQLEKEKSVLVQQLFQARAEIQENGGGVPDTSIFI